MIQKADMVVPKATSPVASMCSQPGTRENPNSMMPMRTASKEEGRQHLVGQKWPGDVCPRFP